MLKVTALMLAALALTACASTNTSSANQAMNWDSISGAKVAKVNNIKSLISPGVY